TASPASPPQAKPLSGTDLVGDAPSSPGASQGRHRASPATPPGACAGDAGDAPVTVGDAAGGGVASPTKSNAHKPLGADGDAGDAATHPLSAPERSYQLVQDRAGLRAVAQALDSATLVALDLETTGLDPRAYRIRLVSLAWESTDGSEVRYLID